MICKYKQIIQNYLKAYNFYSLYSFNIREGLRNCHTDTAVYQKLKVLEYRENIENCKLRGFDNYIPNCNYEFLLDDIIKELDRIKNKENKKLIRLAMKIE